MQRRTTAQLRYSEIFAEKKKITELLDNILFTGLARPKMAPQPRRWRKCRSCCRTRYYSCRR